MTCPKLKIVNSSSVALRIPVTYDVMGTVFDVLLSGRNGTDVEVCRLGSSAQAYDDSRQTVHLRISNDLSAYKAAANGCFVRIEFVSYLFFSILSVCIFIVLNYFQ